MLAIAICLAIPFVKCVDKWLRPARLRLLSRPACAGEQIICKNREASSTPPCSVSWGIQTSSQLKTRVYEVGIFTHFIHKMAEQESQICWKQSNENVDGYAKPGKLSSYICAYKCLMKAKEKPNRVKGISDRELRAVNL